MSLEIINNPILVMLQDKGRYGYSDIGVRNSGVMDEYAYYAANKMLGNSFDTNILEIAFSNVIDFTCSIRIKYRFSLILKQSVFSVSVSEIRVPSS